MRFFLTMAVIFCAPQTALALQKASDWDAGAIEALIEIARSNEDQIKIEREELTRASGKRAKELNATIEKREKVLINTYEQAIWQTIRAYGILPFDQNGQPILPRGTSVLASPEKDKPIAWIPVFEDIGIKPQQNEFGRTSPIRIVGTDVLGNTASDGVSRIHPGAFTSPAELASIINHEYRHFKQITTRGEADVKTAAELEVEAYEEEKRLLDQNVLGFTSEEKDYQQGRLKDLIHKKTALAAKQRAAADRNGGSFRPEPSYPSHSQVDIDSLVEKARAQVAISNRDHDERLLGTLADIVWRTCQIPGSVG